MIPLYEIDNHLERSMPQTVKSILKSFKIIEIVAASSHGIGVIELAQKSNLPAATVHRILRTLVASGYVEQNRLTERYLLTMKMLEIGSHLLSNMDSSSNVAVSLKKLTNRIERASLIAVQSSGENFKEDRINLALNKPVKASTGPAGKHKRPFSSVTDGSTYYGYYIMTETTPGIPQWIEVDLEGIYPIDTIVIWHYYSDNRKYHHNKIAVSTTGKFRGEETVIFDSDVNGEYVETEDGERIDFKPARARYVRNWIDGNTSDFGGSDNHWIEIKVYQNILFDQFSRLE